MRDKNKKKCYLYNMKKLTLSLLLLLALFLCRLDGVAADGSLRPSSLQDLAGQKVAIIIGSVADLELTADNHSMELCRFNNQADMVRALETGKVDAMIADSLMLGAANVLKDWMQVEFSGLFPADIAAVFSYDNLSLYQDFNSYVRSLAESGELERIKEKWCVKDVFEVEPSEAGSGENGTLRVAFYNGNIPMDFVSEERFCGIEPDIVNGFARERGMKVKYFEYEFGAIPAAVKTGKADFAIAAMCISDRRRETILFTYPYQHTSYVCVSRDYEKWKAGRKEKGLRNKLSRYIHDAENRETLLEGLKNTALIAFIAIVLGTLAGAFMTWRYFGPRRKWWHAFLEVYGALMHGIPLLVLLLIMFYIVLLRTDMSALAVATLTFTIYLAYASCEIFVEGISMIPQGQMKAALSLGFNKAQAFRYVILPQAIKLIIPSYKAEVVTLIKETSVAGFISVVDLTKASDIIQGRTFDAFFPIITTAVIYFTICIIVSAGLDKVLKKLNRR